ncbi:MAG: transcriptional repressor LexA [Clostridia bacterium]|nr:transcriptional repressor LexA [Clostridia bacterium]
MAQNLSKRQLDILNFIKSELRTKGYPPSVREIGDAVGLSSSSTVHGHLSQLEKKGYIRRDPTKPRAIEVVGMDNSFDEIYSSRKLINVPIIGQVAAGSPILAEENIEEVLPLPWELVRSENVFMLHVKGDSMINAGIFDGDLVLVRQQKTARNGEIVVALIENEATVKRFFLEKDCIRLQPENDLLEPIYTKDAQIIGKVIGVYRQIH